MTDFFLYGENEIQHLKKCDAKLAAVIDQIGHIDRPVIPDLFEALVNAIAGQQISSRALETVWARMQQRLSPINPAHFDALTAEEIASCGLSMRKAGYLKAIAAQAVSGALDLDALHVLPDDEVCHRLCSLPGVGQWTAEMLLIFSLQRPDVLSFGDFGIRRGLRMVYHHRELTPALFEKYRRRFSPCGTVASLYLWAVSGGAIDGLLDPAPAGPSRARAPAAADR